MSFPFDRHVAWLEDKFKAINAITPVPFNETKLTINKDCRTFLLRWESEEYLGEIVLRDYGKADIQVVEVSSGKNLILSTGSDVQEDENRAYQSLLKYFISTGML